MIFVLLNLAGNNLQMAVVCAKTVRIFRSSTLQEKGDI